MEDWSIRCKITRQYPPNRMVSQHSAYAFEGSVEHRDMRWGGTSYYTRMTMDTNI
jgi:hypothetical protein